MTIKINVGVNKKIGLPDYGSAGSHCAIEIEADNSVLADAEQFLQRVKDAYEVARKSVEEELAHHRPSNGASPSRSAGQSNKEPEQRQDYRNDNSSDSRYIASPKQQQFIASLDVAKLNDGYKRSQRSLAEATGDHFGGVFDKSCNEACKSIVPMAPGEKCSS